MPRSARLIAGIPKEASTARSAESVRQLSPLKRAKFKTAEGHPDGLVGG